MQLVLDRPVTLEVLDESAWVLPSFARHETFHPRYGWLKKGFDAASKMPDVFLRPDAPVLLGVGKNMARAIRYWCSAFQVLVEEPYPDRPRLRISRPTPFGKRLFSDDGWDPFLEEPGSLWLLQWFLLRAPCKAPSWFVTFNNFQQVEFREEDLAREIRRFVESQPGWRGIVQGSIKKDVSCLLRMYAAPTGRSSQSEESLDCPFLELDLIRRSPGESHHCSFNVGPKVTLPDDIVMFASLDFLATHSPGAKTMNARRLAYEPWAPGRVFRLTESALVQALERSARGAGSISVAQVGGVAQLAVSEDPRHLADRVIAAFYHRFR